MFQILQLDQLMFFQCHPYILPNQERVQQSNPAKNILPSNDAFQPESVPYKLLEEYLEFLLA